MRADGEGVRKLRDTQQSECPFWSPDSKRIAFAESSDGPRVIRVYASTGIEEASFLGAEKLYGFSPTGDRLLFTKVHGVGTPTRTSEIFSSNVDGSDMRFLSIGQSPSWARAADAIAFECGGICMMAGDGAQKQQLTSDPYSLRPALSPDGKVIAYICAPDALCFISSSGTPIARLSGDAAPYWLVRFVWSADAKTLAYECQFVTGGGNSVEEWTNICTVNWNGTGFRRLSSDRLRDQFVSYAGSGDD
jgi:Tol biopolymer transport system component